MGKTCDQALFSFQLFKCISATTGCSIFIRAFVLAPNGNWIIERTMTLRTIMTGHAYCDIVCSFEDLIHLETVACIKPSFNWGKEIENCICQSLAESGMMCNKSNIATMSLSCPSSFMCTDLAILGNNTLCRMLWGGTTGGRENARDCVTLSSVLTPGTSCVTMGEWCLWVACWVLRVFGQSGK